MHLEGHADVNETEFIDSGVLAPFGSGAERGQRMHY
jgi:hypothetical protein